MINMIVEHKSRSAEARGRHVFYPLVWTRLVREYGEFGVVIQSTPSDYIDSIVLINKNSKDGIGSNTVEEFDTIEELKERIHEISKTYGIRISDKEMQRIDDFRATHYYYNETPGA